MAETSETAPPEKRRRAPTKRVKDRPLTEADWVEAAIDILVDENVRGIQLHKLCDRLGVTKGSFYWHFKKRSDLLAAMLNTWRSRMTLNVIRSVTRAGPGGMERLRHRLPCPAARNPRPSPRSRPASATGRGGWKCRARRSGRWTRSA